MPDKLFLTTGIPACLFILSKNRDGRDGEHRQRQQEVLFIDARKLGQMDSRRLRVFHDEDIAKVADTYHQWRNLNGSYTDIDGFCKAATLPEIEANNFVLSPGRYVGSEAEETDGVPFEEKMQLLTAELAAHFAEGAELETKIKKSLAEIGLRM
jgi:type I restriction enzyme M protein